MVAAAGQGAQRAFAARCRGLAPGLAGSLDGSIGRNRPESNSEEVTLKPAAAEVPRLGLGTLPLLIHNALQQLCIVVAATLPTSSPHPSLGRTQSQLVSSTQYL